MNAFRSSALILVLLSAAAAAQIQTINFPAGSPEDQAIQSIAKESDPSVQSAKYSEFVQTYAGNPMAVAYGYSQLAQLANAAGKPDEALALGEKALAAVPNNLDMLVAQVTFAQAAKRNDKAVEYAARGGQLIASIAAAPKPAGVSDEDYATQRDQAIAAAQPTLAFLEGAAYTGVANEEDPKKRWTAVELYDASFPQSQYAEAVATLGMYALQQQGDYAQLAKYGAKLATQYEKSLSVLSMLASMLAEDPKRGYDTAAAKYAKQAVELAEAEDVSGDPAKKLAAGLAHGALGWVYMKQEKTAAAIGELKAAAPLVADNEAAASTVLFRLGFAQAKLKQYAAARESLNKCAAIKGPNQGEARKLLAKIANQ